MSGIDLIKPIYFNWHVDGLGFGQLYFYQDEDGTIHCDNELLTKETVKKIFDLLLDQSKFECV